MLLVTTLGHLFSAGVMAVAGVLVLAQNPNRNLNRAFFLGVSSVSIYATSLAIGINLEPSTTAYVVWMFNLANFFTATAFLHFTLIVLKIETQTRWLIRSTYTISILLVLASLLFPTLFIPELTPKLFTLSYLNAGPLYTIMTGYFMAVAVVAFFALLIAYARNIGNRRQLEYFIAAALFGFGFGSIDFFLVYDIPTSPLYGIFFGLYVVPIAYGILADELLDIRIVFKKALFYSIGIAGITAILMALILLNNIFVETFPWVQVWTIPILTAAVSFFIARLFWKQLIENERVKYEFITVATHKLRTPLTQISWGVRTLLDDKNINPEVRDIAEHIHKSSNRLIELTNILFESTDENATNYAYTKEEIDLKVLAENAVTRLTPIIGEKKVKITIDAPDTVFVLADIRRITSVIEVFIENAVSYTPEGGSVVIAINYKGRKVRFAVKDTGIGILPKEKKNVFLKFYRSDEAKKVDTEGVGLGLAMSKNIIKKHKGKIGVESDGKGKGSTFWFEIPKA